MTRPHARRVRIIRQQHGAGATPAAPVCEPDLIETVVGAADQLGAVVALAESGELGSERDQVAYLRGAADTLRMLADRL